MIGGGDTLRLRERGAIGDTATMALVAADGTIDWWCPGRFDAPAAFFRLLDPAGGALRVGPAGVPRAGPQSYEPSTNVLRTRLPAPEGLLELTDFLPWNGKRASGRIVRLLTVLWGRVEVEVDVVPGRAFGPGREVSTWSSGIAFDGVVVHTGCPMEGRQGRLTLEAGERGVVVVEPEAERPSEAVSVEGALDLADRTTTAWRSYVGPLTYDGPYRREVERSLLALGALTYGPSGAVVAAATTSLPERTGGERNWDYRYAWVRDAALAAGAGYATGLVEAAEAHNDWLLGILGRARSGDGPERSPGRSGCFPLRPMYDVEGLALDPGDERELGLAGWRGSQPVRTGNAAADHLQFDFYADLVDALFIGPGLPDRGPNPGLLGTVGPQPHAGGAGLSEELWGRLVGMADWLAEAWREPDRGSWEIRSEPRHLTSSKLACWYTLDRMAQLARARNPLDLAAAHWRGASQEVAAWLDANGRAAGGGLRADTSPADLADAHLVQLAWRNPWAGDERVVTRTVDRVIAQLGSGPFVARYDDQFPDGLPAGEGAFLACSFWVVEALARLGRWEEAHERMEALCGFSRPLGLVPEQADPASGQFLGNLPHALGHLALVRAALALAAGPR
ncbi:MAG: hypothetical protein KY439_11675 [Actinobacteria bacterium]|nr:hypothetical protein [Actinomycetota bacterium]